MNLVGYLDSKLKRSLPDLVLNDFIKRLLIDIHSPPDQLDLAQQ